MRLAVALGGLPTLLAFAGGALPLGACSRPRGEGPPLAASGTTTSPSLDPPATYMGRVLAQPMSYRIVVFDVAP